MKFVLWQLIPAVFIVGSLFPTLSPAAGIPTVDGPNLAQNIITARKSVESVNRLVDQINVSRDILKNSSGIDLAFLILNQFFSFYEDWYLVEEYGVLNKGWETGKFNPNRPHANSLVKNYKTDFLLMYGASDKEVFIKHHELATALALSADERSMLTTHDLENKKSKITIYKEQHKKLVEKLELADTLKKAIDLNNQFLALQTAIAIDQLIHQSDTAQLAAKQELTRAVGYGLSKPQHLPLKLPAISN